MTAAPDFRLPKDVRPLRYALELDLDLADWRFSGQEEIAVRLARPASEVAIHALDLEIASAGAVRDGLELSATVRYEPEAEIVLLRFPSALPAGECRLRLAFSGEIARELRGLYRSTRPGERYAVTQFAPVDARRAFPCFDEPEFKARFALTLIAPEGLATIANAPVVRSEPAAAGRMRTSFAETPPISTYLVALAVGPYEATPEARTSHGVPVRVWLPSDMVGRATFVRDAHVRSLEWLEEYTAIPYPYRKVDAIGIPDFSAGAMENPGAITYRLRLLAADPQTAAAQVLRDVFGTASHELTHMWWGDLVTLAWWDDIWLNESFATFVGEKARDALEPAWGVWRDFVADTAGAFRLDALVSTHPISAQVGNAREADERFDAISYEKGAAVLRMLEAFLGEATFRDAVRLYLRRHAESNAAAADFWRALDEASGRDVTRLATAWITEPGYPIVTCRTEPTADGLRIEIAQRRFFEDGDAPSSSQRWPVPMVFRYGTEREVRSREVLLSDERATVDLPGAGWYFPNAGGSGFYRYALDEPGLGRLLEHVAALAPEERVSLVEDTWALTRAGASPLALFLALLRSLRRERDRGVFEQIATADNAAETWGALSWLDAHAVSARARPAFARVVREIAQDRFAELGWDPRDEDSDDDRQLRGRLIETLGRIGGDPEVRRASRSRIEAHLSGRSRLQPDVATAAARVAATNGDAALLDRFVSAIVGATSDPQEEQRFRFALAEFADPHAAARAVDVCFSELVRDQDFPQLLNRMLERPGTRAAAWEAIRERWDERVSRLEPFLRQRVVKALAHLTPSALAPEALEFLERRRTPDVTATTDQAIERLRIDSAAAARLTPQLEDALR